MLIKIYDYKCFVFCLNLLTQNLEHILFLLENWWTLQCCFFYECSMLLWSFITFYVFEKWFIFVLFFVSFLISYFIIPQMFVLVFFHLKQWQKYLFSLLIIQGLFFVFTLSVNPYMCLYRALYSKHSSVNPQLYGIYMLSVLMSSFRYLKHIKVWTRCRNSLFSVWFPRRHHCWRGPFPLYWI